MTTVPIVDDEPQILRALQINLHAHGYVVVPAPNGATALAAAQTQAIDVVVLDLGLPDMDGLDVIAGLLPTGPRTTGNTWRAGPW